jgi:negative regulator of flagellin synthesis FlgM
MASKIDASDNRPAPTGPSRPVARTADVVSRGPGNPAGRPGDLHITDSASKLASLEQALRSLPALDEARVAQIRTAIREGRYTIQPERIAEQLMQLEHALGGLQDPRKPEK